MITLLVSVHRALRELLFHALRRQYPTIVRPTILVSVPETVLRVAHLNQIMAYAGQLLPLPEQRHLSPDGQSVTTLLFVHAIVVSDEHPQLDPSSHTLQSAHTVHPLQARHVTQSLITGQFLLLVAVL